MLLGRLAVICFPGEIIFRCNLLSLLATALSAGLLATLINLIYGRARFSRLTAASIATAMAFMPVWWNQGTSNEVYALTLLFDLLVMIMMVKYADSRQIRHLVCGLYILALSFGVHLSTIFLIPALIYLLLTTDGIGRNISKRYLWPVIFFIFGLSTYFYLPIRAAFKPFLNWSDPASLAGFINHISGWQYRVWMFGSIDTMLNGARYFLQLFYSQFGLIGLGLTILGSIHLFKKNLRLSVFAIAIVLGDIAYCINYEILDIDSYYLIGFACLAQFAAAGLIQIFATFERLSKRGRALSRPILAILAVALPAGMLIVNFSARDKSRDILAAKSVEMMLASIDENGLAIVENWDLYSPWLYYRYALDIRPDVNLIDKELLRRSWYLDFLKRACPEIAENSRTEIDSFLKLLEPFEHGRNYDPEGLTAAYRSMIGSLIKNNRDTKPVYTNILHDPDVAPDLFRNPVGVIYRLDDQPLCHQFDLNKINFAAWDSPAISIDRRARVIFGSFALALANRAALCGRLGNQAEADKYIELLSKLKIF